MRLFRRIGDIIAANLNDLVNRFEDPEVMLKQAIREMETMIEDATAGAARAIAGERLLARDLADHQEKARRWNARAEEAVVLGDDDLARQAIARALEHEAIARALDEQRSAAEQTAQALRGQIHAMRAKQAEARRKLASLSARRRRPKPAVLCGEWPLNRRVERTASLGTIACMSRSIRPRRKPRPWQNFTRLPNPDWRPRSRRASKLDASKRSSLRSKVGSGPHRDLPDRKLAC